MAIVNGNTEFAGKVAMVTGAGQGMGRAVAARLAAAGARVVVNDISAESAERTAKALSDAGHDATAVAGDVSRPDAVREMFRTAVDHYGALHVLVNNAGILYPTAVEDMDADEWDLVIAVNLRGTFLCSQAAIGPMREAGWGRIVNFSSTAGKNVSTVGGAHYTAAKAGVLGFTRHLAKEVAAYGITVNAVCPGLIDTEMVRTVIDPERADAYARGFPIERLGEPGEVAELVAFLASDRASYITGASLDINGGDLMI